MSSLHRPCWKLLTSFLMLSFVPVAAAPCGNVAVLTLLPRHWGWLAAQPGGASVTLRKLVDEARRANVDRDRQRRASECAYRFMPVMAGDMAGFEEASRALFANDAAKFRQQTEAWPADVRDCVRYLACPLPLPLPLTEVPSLAP